jgi:hypothetical protein
MPNNPDHLVVLFKTPKPELGVASHTYNTSYSEGRDSRIPVQGQPRQKVNKTLISTNKPSMVASACHPTYAGGIRRSRS